MRLMSAAVLAACIWSPAFAADRDKCSATGLMMFKATSESRDQRIIKTVRHIQKIARLRRVPILLCSPHDATGSPVPMVVGLFLINLGSGVAMYVPQQLKDYSDRELLGTLAHEVAHITLFKRDGIKRFSSFEEMLAREYEVDAIAARWVGADAVVAGLRQFRRSVVMYHQSVRPSLTGAEYQSIGLEIAGRIYALERNAK